MSTPPHPPHAPLAEYRKRRDFRRTPEPAGRGVSRARDRLSFVVQKHAASRLHYDFRLEMNGTLKSWAIPKGPSLDPKDKRLAVEVEDHPLEYGKFEGTIPKGEYGGGSVLLWDRGIWIPEGDPSKGLRAGKLKFMLVGEKLHGRYSLVRMRTRPGEKEDRPQWLLIKEKDSEARSARDHDLLVERPESVVTGRRIEEIGNPATRGPGAKARSGGRGRAPARSLNPSTLPGARRAALPGTILPQLATLVDRTPPGDDWMYEIKLDGYRISARLENGRVALLSRNGNDWTARFPGVSQAVKELTAARALIDGEVVVLEPDGTTSFQALQNVLSRKSAGGVVYFAFDLLHLDGYDLTNVPIERRKELLARLLPAKSQGALRYTAHVVGRGEEFHRAACDHALEGVIAKRMGKPYRPGRGHDWLKIKCLERQEFVVGGYTDPAGSRTGMGALLLGVYDENGTLRYAGRVGTGFNDSTLTDLSRRLARLEVAKTPFSNPPQGANRGTHWVRPTLVAEVEFTGWTNDGRLRHPSFQGLREDKKAREVVRERRTRLPALVSGTGVRLTNPGKVLFPEPGLTKQDLADYYRSVAKWMLPYVANRPLMVLRCPDGYAKQCFYQKNAPEEIPAGLGPVTIPDPEGGPDSTYLTVEGAEGLLALVQWGVLEVHIWGSRAGDIESPDRIVFDLDPGPGVSWEQVIEGATTMRDTLERLGLAAFLLATGGKGLHVVVPLIPDTGWSDVKEFAKAVVDLVVRQDPARYTGYLSKQRRQRKIFLDYLRNGRGATAVAPYSTRARPGAPVAMPLAWDELSPRLRPDAFHVKNAMKRLQTAKDPWASYGKKRVSLSGILEAARKRGSGSARTRSRSAR